MDPLREVPVLQIAHHASHLLSGLDAARVILGRDNLGQSILPRPSDVGQCQEPGQLVDFHAGIDQRPLIEQACSGTQGMVSLNALHGGPRTRHQEAESVIPCRMVLIGMLMMIVPGYLSRTSSAQRTLSRAL